MSYAIEHTQKCIKDNKTVIAYCESRISEGEDVATLQNIIDQLKERGQRLESRLSELLSDFSGTLGHSADTKTSPLI
jgi:hypothetical protein